MKKLLGFAGILILSVIIVFIGFDKFFFKELRQAEKTIADTKQENLLTGKTVAQNSEPYYDEVLNFDGVKRNLAAEDCIYQIMHEMANTKVVADVTYATMDITPDRVNALIKAVNQTNWEDKSRLLEILNRWKTGDFSQGVEDHNYVWTKLGGEVGKATALKQ
jgi:hypothetical protein